MTATLAKSIVNNSATNTTFSALISCEYHSATITGSSPNITTIPQQVITVTLLKVTVMTVMVMTKSNENADTLLSLTLHQRKCLIYLQPSSGVLWKSLISTVI